MKDVPPEVQELLQKNPVLFGLIGLMAIEFLSRSYERPKWLKDCPRIHDRRNGPWRGKGSFGTGFGRDKVKHK